MQAYSDKSLENDPHSLPDLEIFEEPGRPGYSPGWYWWSCFPGCLPDSEPFGPFKSPEDALKDARKWAW